MPLALAWPDVLLRLGLALIAGAAFGLNRSERGHAAGLRMTILVSLAAAAAMIQVNLLLVLSQQKQSLVALDLMRLPLGILSGIGFIGGGAILKRGETIHGVTTAATLWFVTVMGLCLGGGQFALGLELLALGLLVLTPLRWVERRFVDQRHGTLTLAIADDGPSEEDVRRVLVSAGFSLSRCALDSERDAGVRRIVLDVRWRSHDREDRTPVVVEELLTREGVRGLRWEPHE
jgi:putative Mg2+ transporter-C (MgtC) family protein